MQLPLTMKKTLVIFLLCLLSCNNTPPSTTGNPDTSGADTTRTGTDRSQASSPADTLSNVHSNDTIIAGQSVGKIQIGASDATLNMLGKADLSDAAMGKAWLTWYGKQDETNRTELNVYTAYRD